MAPRGYRTTGRVAGIVGAVLVVLLGSGCALQSTASAGPERAVPVAVTADAGPVVQDSAGVPLTPEHAAVVTAVYNGLRACDLAALRELYTGDEWTAQAALLALPQVRQQVIAAMETAPANLGEGYVYGAGPYQVGFFLAPEDGGPLQWRGIQAPPGLTVRS